MFTHITMHHFRAIKAWVDIHGGEANLDVSTFELEVKARHRYFKLLPQFMYEQNGKLLYSKSLLPNSTAFVGWRPYAPFSLRFAAHKLMFKRMASAAGLRTPLHWEHAREATQDFILKQPMGAFGYHLAGPFHRGEDPSIPANLKESAHAGDVFAEAFVRGRILKVWFWGSRPVHVQTQHPPEVIGDGVSTVDQLISVRLSQFDVDWATYLERHQALGCLAYQGIQVGDVLPKGQSAWFDYRYGRHFAGYGNTEAQDNAWHSMPSEERAQVIQAGKWLEGAMKADVPAPVLCAMDGVIDADGHIWWLELNSNPICPPNAYFEMFATLFGTDADAPESAYAKKLPIVQPQPPSAVTAPTETAQGVVV